MLEVHYRLWDWFIGSLFVGPLIGCIGGGVVYLVARKFHDSNMDAGTM